ncbi:hypothetical protein LCGC14_1157380 [marine sediment metagenome]|uniref:Uncharacterized protein n=1 Tax=marine sediment metagenome TaxID=412755 RepID=A0A0F9MGR7_9ZZZZ
MRKISIMKKEMLKNKCDIIILHLIIIRSGISLNDYEILIEIKFYNNEIIIYITELRLERLIIEIFLLIIFLININLETN